jgi:hypothetical protein
MRYSTFHVPAQCVSTITPENILLRHFSKTKPKTHEYVVSKIREPDNMGAEGGTQQNRNGRAPARGASLYRLVIQPSPYSTDCADMGWLTCAGTSRFACHRHSPGLAFSARGARVRRYASDCTKCHRTKDDQRPGALILQGDFASTKRSHAATSSAAQRR